MMTEAEKKAEAYADNKLLLRDPEFAATSYSRHTKMGVNMFNGGDIEEAWYDGYVAAITDACQYAQTYLLANNNVDIFEMERYIKDKTIK